MNYLFELFFVFMAIQFKLGFVDSNIKLLPNISNFLGIWYEWFTPRWRPFSIQAMIWLKRYRTGDKICWYLFEPPLITILWNFKVAKKSKYFISSITKIIFLDN